MVILGIDPGLTVTGWGVLSFDASTTKFIDCGFIKGDPKKQDISARLANIYRVLLEVIEYYHVHAVAIEDIFVNSNPASALKLGYARGVALMVAGYYSLDLSEYSATTIKKTVTGNGHASKLQVEQMLALQMPDFKTFLQQKIQHDAVDALAIALCHRYHIQLKY